MKKFLFLFLFIPFLSQAQVTFDSCLVSGYIYAQNGAIEDSLAVTVIATSPRGTARPIISTARRTFYSNANGYIEMTLLRNSVVTISAKLSNINGYANLTIPDAATAEFATLVPSSNVAAGVTVAIPLLTITDGTNSASDDSLQIGSGLELDTSGDVPVINALAAGYGDSISQAYSIATTARDIANGKGDADSVKLAFNILGGKGDSDSLAIAYANASAALSKSDTTALHAQKFAILNDKDAGYADGDSVSLQIKAVKDLIGGKAPSDSVKTAYDTLAAHRITIDTKQNVLSAAQIARIDSMLAAGDFVTITSQGGIRVISVDTTGFFAAFGGVMTESDPLAIAKDTASLAVYGDQLYPRTAGSAVDTTRILPIGGANKNFTGNLTSSDTLLARSIVPNAGDTLRFALPSAMGVNTNRALLTRNAGSTVLLLHPSWGSSRGLMMTAMQALDEGRIGIASDGAKIRVLATRVIFANSVDVHGGAIVRSDTFRVGDWTTYSYIVPGGALVSSSTQEIKQNIADVPTPTGLFSKFLAVHPKRYQFKPGAFRSVTFASTPDTLTDAERWALVAADSTKAEQLAKRWQVGLLAEEFNDMLGRTGREIDQAEVSAVLWKVLQETLRAGNQLRTEVDALKAQVQQLQTAGANLNARLKALEDARK